MNDAVNTSSVGQHNPNLTQLSADVVVNARAKTLPQQNIRWWLHAIWLAIIAIIVGGLVWYFGVAKTGGRSSALYEVLRPLTTSPVYSLAANAIVINFDEVRTNATLWSGVYWGLAFLSTVVSALAGVILKFEVILTDDKVKRDVAAILSMIAAILIAISSTGDFQHKWQANRVAAAELEQLAYEFAAKPDEKHATVLEFVGKTLRKRHISIVGADPTQ
jgi:uncharacterized membrane protein